PSKDALKLHIFRQVFSIVFHSLIIIFLNKRNYLILLLLAISWFGVDVFYLAAKAFELNHQAWNIYAIFGGKFLDYLFMFIGLWCIMALVLANFYATLALVIFSLLNLAPTLYAILTIPSFYFTSDPQTIVSDPFAMNKVVFIGNIQVSIIIIIGTL